MFKCGILLAGRIDMETLYISGEADISRDEGTILVKTSGLKRRVPVEGVKHIVVLADGIVTTKFLGLVGRAGVRVSFFDHYGWYVGSFEPGSNVGAGEMRMRQASAIANSPMRMAVASEIVRASMDNIVDNLRYYANRGKPELREGIVRIQALRNSVIELEDTETLMGFEGNARKIYYAAWGAIDSKLDFGLRTKRPPNNRVNCLISFLNGVAYSAVRHEIAKTHLDETMSFLHSPSSQRSSLSLDLSEPFKPVVVDRIIFRLVRKNMLSDSWFDEKPGICMLSETGRKAVVEAFVMAVDKGDPSLRRHMRSDALKLQRFLLGMEGFSAFRPGDTL
jgi:CRISPR-associated protein Cas1